MVEAFHNTSSLNRKYLLKNFGRKYLSSIKKKFPQFDTSFIILVINIQHSTYMKCLILNYEAIFDWYNNFPHFCSVKLIPKANPWMQWTGWQKIMCIIQEYLPACLQQVWLVLG